MTEANHIHLKKKKKKVQWPLFFFGFEHNFNEYEEQILIHTGLRREIN